MRKHDEFLSTTDYTAQEYFERNGESQFPNAQAGIAMTCLTYLSFDVFGSDPCTDNDFLLRDNPFHDYAATHWGDHARGQEETVKSLALGLLQDSSKAACAGDVLASWWDPPADYSGMHVSSFFGLAKITDYQLKNGAIADSKSSKGKSPLSIAAENGHESVVKLLLTRDDVDLNSKDCEAVVKLLLARDDIDAIS